MTAEPHEGMSPESFRAWLDHMGFSERKAAEKLGRSRNKVAACLEEGADLTTALACAALAAGLTPWKPEEEEMVDFEERAALVKAAYAAKSLADLYVAVTAYEDWREQNYKLDDRVAEMDPDWQGLPTFGGERPEPADDDWIDTPMSWDEHAVLLRTKGTRMWALTGRRN